MAPKVAPVKYSLCQGPVLHGQTMWQKLIRKCLTIGLGGCRDCIEVYVDTNELSAEHLWCAMAYYKDDGANISLLWYRYIAWVFVHACSARYNVGAAC